jgi:protein-tyrosine-phosphatase
VNGMTASRTVMFVCLHGAAKSVIAGAYFNRMAAERGFDLTAGAAGLEPEPEIPSAVRQSLLADGLDVGAVRPRRATRDDLTSAWRIVSFGCDLTGTAPPGRAVEQWDDVPAVSDGFPAARDAIVARVRTFLDACAAAGRDG